MRIDGCSLRKKNIASKLEWVGCEEHETRLVAKPILDLAKSVP